ncbi:manganese catalase family protein [Salicibibacter halophilus]|uniref:Manganese catalase family protein n=1 Tax=Salicibibacter halophilus TaxID=2502791 RepID=A0A514LG16_9BACI|nr:manganese catalase family protein [Salicibibacter halophilus]QDI90797.1 manganese catalase family protein [Salicibibacter halophilus]
MFYHFKELQYPSKPERPDPAYAKRLQEILGGQFGEITTTMQYLMQGFNTRADAKFRDLILDIATEEIGHIEMAATMIARLLNESPTEEQEKAYKSDPALAAVIDGENPLNYIVAGAGAMAVDAEGNAWTSDYIISSGNLLADFRANFNLESQGRLQVVRLYNMTDDRGVKDLLSFFIARETAHQNIWREAIHDLENREGDIVVPTTFPREKQFNEVAYDFYNFSEGEESTKGPWTSGPAPDSKGEFQYYDRPVSYGKEPHLKSAHPKLHNTMEKPDHKHPHPSKHHPGTYFPYKHGDKRDEGDE